jgi:surface protein
MKKISLQIILLIFTAQAIQSQTVVLDANNITVKWTGTTIPSPYFVQANPRGTGMEWFAIVNNTTKSNITNYAKNIQSGITYFTPPSTTTPIPFDNIVTTLVTNMGDMFSNANGFNQPIGSWDVSNVIIMSGMFYEATAFNQNIGSWNVSNVTGMSLMFTEADAFNQNIGAWNVSNVNNMSSMFTNATAFNQNIGAWNVSNVTNMSTMFTNTTAFNQNIGAWNVSNVTNMSSMFTSAGISTANYDALLIGWATISPNEVPLKPNVVFSGGNSKYCNGASARNILDFTPNNWTITDGGLDCSSLDIETFDIVALKLYPNPVLNILNVKVDNNFINQPYTIIDGLGRVVLNGKLNEVDSTINVEQLSKGIYYLKVSSKNSSKFIKE